VALLFDVDEHTGMFGGAKAFFENDPGPRPDGVMIGYPGPDHVVTGGRGVLRARLHVHGVAGHSGSGTATPSAIAKAAGLISRLHDAELPGPAGPGFPAPGPADGHRGQWRGGCELLLEWRVMVPSGE
jgi:succinyl-diaminopimelate desuccinylase